MREILWQLAPPVGVFLLMVLFFPEREQFQFSVDEGFHVMWAMLFEQGHALYSDIWIDQPPLLTYVLATAFRVLSYKVGIARYIILLFSSILIWATFQYLQALWGRRTAVWGFFLIVMLPNYLILSITVRQSIPNLTFVMLALFFLIKWHQNAKTGWLISSAVALGASILVKIYTGFLAPVFTLGIWIATFSHLSDKRRWLRSLWPSLLWSLIFLAVLILGVMVFIGIENLPDLVSVHLSKNSSTDKLTDFTIAYHMKRSYTFLFLALVGSAAAIHKKQWLALYPLAWAATAYVMLSFYYPVWSHYKPLIDIPLALLGAYAVDFAYDLFKDVIQRFRPYFSGSPRQLIQLVAVVALIGVFFRLPKGLGILECKPTLSGSGLMLTDSEHKFLELIIDNAPQTEWIITDMPMYAFRARLPVPPNLALISQSRIDTGYITEQEIISTIEQYQPEQVFLGHYPFPQVIAYLDEYYTLLRSQDGLYLYLRPDLNIQN